MEELLIEKVRGHVCLYDIRCPDYRDNEKRISAWEEIGSELSLNPEKAKKEWEKLRRCFTNALHRRRQRKSQGEGAKKIPPWKYEKEMSFLMPSYKVKQPRYNLQDQVEELEDLSDCHEHATYNSSELSFKTDPDEDSNPDPMQLQISDFSPNAENEVTPARKTEIKRRKRKRPEDDQNSVEGMVDCILRENSPRRSRIEELFRDLDETDMFFLSLARTTKTLPLVDQARVKLMVSQAVLQAQISVAEQAAHVTRLPESATSNMAK